MNEDRIRTYKDWIVWHKSMDLVVLVYEVTDEFPQQERYGLIAQIRRAAVSIPSNIAEGSRRRTDKDQTHFLNMAFGSGAELETQIDIARRLGYLLDEKFKLLDDLLSEVMKMLNKMLSTRSAF